jgi:hypothetical protein
LEPTIRRHGAIIALAVAANLMLKLGAGVMRRDRLRLRAGLGAAQRRPTLVLGEPTLPTHGLAIACIRLGIFVIGPCQERLNFVLQ